MRNLILVLTVMMMSQFVFAAKVGDYAKYRFNWVSPTQTMTGTLSQKIKEESPDKYKIASATDLGSGNVTAFEEWKAKKEICDIQDMSLSDLQHACVQQNGVFGNVTVAAGTFPACTIQNLSSSISVGTVPFCLIKMSVSNDQGVTSMDLLEYKN